MRSKEFNLDNLINSLNGSCDTINSLLPNDMYEDDLTQKEIETIDENIFCCVDCGWWDDVEESNDIGGELVCNDCKDLR